MNSDNNTKKETDERQKRNGSYGRNAGYNTRKQVNIINTGLRQNRTADIRKNLRKDIPKRIRTGSRSLY